MFTEPSNPFSLYNTPLTALQAASLYNQNKIANYLIKQGANPNVTGTSQMGESMDNTPLMCAAIKGNMELLELFIDYNAELDATDFEKETALYKAIQRKQHEAAIYLIEKGANVNISRTSGIFPIDIACFNEELSVINALIARKSKMFNAVRMFVDRQKESEDSLVTFTELVAIAGKEVVDKGFSGGNTALHLAAKKQKNKFAAILLAANADVNSVDKKRRTALDIAFLKGNQTLIGILLENGACATTPLHLAIKNHQGSKKILALITEDNVNIQNDDGDTPLHLAIRQMDSKTAEILTQSGANLNNIKNNAGLTPADEILAITSIKSQIQFLQLFNPIHSDKYDEILTRYLEENSNPFYMDDKPVRALIELGATPDCHNRDGNTILHFAAINAPVKQELIGFLFEKGASIDALNEKGETPLFYGLFGAGSAATCCVDTEQLKPWKTFIEHDAKLDVINREGLNMLQKATVGYHESIFEWLCSVGADVDATLNNGVTLIFAEASKTKGSLTYAIDCGANMNWQDEEGNTPLHQAVVAGNKRAIWRLIENGADYNIKNKAGKKPIDIAPKKIRPFIQTKIDNRLKKTGAAHAKQSSSEFGQTCESEAKHHSKKQQAPDKNLFFASSQNDSEDRYGEADQPGRLFS